MNDDERDRLVAELIDRSQQRERILREANVSGREREELTALANTADLLWLSAHGAPKLQDDPAAAMLGLVPDRECQLASTGLSRARKRRALSVSGLAERLRERGWQFQTSDVFRWETHTAADLPPAVVQAIADILGTPVADLITAPSLARTPDLLTAARQSPLFEQLVERWARLRRVSPATARAALETRMLATVHRGERPDTEQLLRSLEALVAAVERDAGGA